MRNQTLRHIVSELPRIFKFVENPVRWDPSIGHDSFTVSGIGSLTEVLKGLGFLYFYDEGHGLRNEFGLLESFHADYSTTAPQEVTVVLDASARVPCSGIITETRDGAFVIAPVLYLDKSDGRDIVLMLASPSAPIRDLSVDKTMLQIASDEATVTLFAGGGELRCLGNVSGKGVKAGRLVLNRNPGCPVFPAGYDETLCELEGPGEVFAVWKPVARSFEECLIVFPSSQTISFEDIAEYLGAPEDDFTGTMKSYVVADGVGVNYQIRLDLDRGLGRHSSDEANLTVT